ncbi:MAG: recombinase family protein [Labilithrix sp.]|nr:recombinase family protein [Labilithrix sp.]
MKNTRIGEPQIGVAYLRASSDDQRLSPAVQRAAIETYSQKAGITIVSWHVDQGVSGGKDLDDRPGLVAALADLKMQRASTLIVQRRDRLARDVYIAATIERAVERVGACVVSADGTGNGETPADAFMRTILDAAAQYERALIRARTRAALRAKRAKGFRVGGVPFGFAVDDDGRLHACPAEQEIIATMMQLRRDGLSLRAIVRECEERGLRSRVGKSFQLIQVARIVRAGMSPSSSGGTSDARATG